MAREMVGDGKLPNRYFVSLSSDYAYQHIDEEGVSCLDYIGDIAPDWEEKYSRGGAVAMFKTYQDAKNYAEEEHYIGEKVKDDQGEEYTLNRITIEDRLSGELYESEHVLSLETGRTFTATHEDTGFTERTMKEKGRIFR